MAIAMLDVITLDYNSLCLDPLSICLEIVYACLLFSPVQGLKVGTREHIDHIDTKYELFLSKLQLTGQPISQASIVKTRIYVNYVAKMMNKYDLFTLQ